jgi:hypothetical protein
MTDKTITLSLGGIDKDVLDEMEQFARHFNAPLEKIVYTLLRDWTMARKSAREHPQLIGLA